MKFATLFVAIAAAALVQKDGEKAAADPLASATARSKSLKAALDAVAEQNRFEAEHAAMHANNMANAEQECQDHKNSVRSARAAQVAGGDQYPTFKNYASAEKKE